ncbi:MAG: hypothetical protein LAO31_13860 [Acidobacteriia bacterium]|nr:hypothetical protein [Terriglobia bacterium]
MFRRSLFLLLIFLAGTLSCLGQNTVTRYVEPEGGFSFSVPSDWTVEEVPGQKYRMVFAPAVDGFAPNINVADEPALGSVESFVAARLRGLPKLFEGANGMESKTPNQSDFITKFGQRGIRVITQMEFHGRVLRQAEYFFQGREGKVIVLTCTVPTHGGEAFDRMFDESMKTFSSETSAPRFPAALFGEGDPVVG